MKSKLIFVAILATCGSIPAQSHAKDLIRLAELLTPAYTAMNYGAICTARSPWYGQNVRGPLGPMPAYAQHIKEEVIAGLPEEQAQFVMVNAADASKATALAQLRKFGPRFAVDEQRLGRWCDLEAKRFIMDVIFRHDTDHVIFLRTIIEAKSDEP